MTTVEMRQKNLYQRQVSQGAGVEMDGWFHHLLGSIGYIIYWDAGNWLPFASHMYVYIPAWRI